VIPIAEARQVLAGVRTGGPDVRVALLGEDGALTVDFVDGLAHVANRVPSDCDLIVAYSGPLVKLLSQCADPEQITVGGDCQLPPLGVHVEASLDHIDEPVLVQHVIYHSFVGVIRMYDIISSKGIHRVAGSAPRSDVVIRSQYGPLSKARSATGFRAHFAQSRFTPRSVGALMTAAHAYEHHADRFFSDDEDLWEKCGRLSLNVRSPAWRAAVKIAVNEVSHAGL